MVSNFKKMFIHTDGTHVERYADGVRSLKVELEKAMSVSAFQNWNQRTVRCRAMKWSALINSCSH